MSVEALNCQCCGAALKVSGSICECEYCGATNIICGDTGKFINLLNRANSLRQQCEFDRAFRVYDEILAQNPPTADVLWAQTLCEYGIEYVKDPASNRYIPTMHLIKDERILASKNYLDALELCDGEQKDKLIESAKEIQDIQDEYLNIASNEKPYDVFICYKETDDDTGKQTEDSGLALDLYERLENYGYKVFFSRVTLQDKIGVNFEPYIFAALKSAQVMVVIGTRPEYFEATWVRNEWSRFFKLKENDKSKQLFFACDNVDDLPRAFSQRQAQLLTEPNSIQNLAYNIKKYITIARENTESKTQSVIAKCTNCNKEIEVNPSKEAAVCPHCNKPYIVAKAIENAAKKEVKDTQSENKGFDVSRFKEEFKQGSLNYETQEIEKLRQKVGMPPSEGSILSIPVGGIKPGRTELFEDKIVFKSKKGKVTEVPVSKFKKVRRELTNIVIVYEGGPLGGLGFPIGFPNAAMEWEEAINKLMNDKNH